jgi:DNA-directed RNA polymerase specialized sigma24 family protein
MKVFKGSNVQATDRAIEALGEKLSTAVKVHYLLRSWSLAQQADALQCSVSTLVARVDRAHQLLHPQLCMELEGS